MNLEDRIIRTVAYFDLFDYPLTRAEIRRWIWGSDVVLFGEVDQVVDKLISRGVFCEGSSFIWVHDRQDLIKIREDRFRHSARKWARAGRWANIFSKIPGIVLVGVGNTLSYNNAKDSSDIDFFIVTTPGTIWRSRIICALMAALFNLRPRPGDNRDKICLSFFVTTEALNLMSFCKLKRGENHKDLLEDDVYLHYWIKQMVPLAGINNVANQFFAQNGDLTERGIIGKPDSWKWLFAPLGYLRRDFIKTAQNKHFPQVIRDAENRNDGSVIISDKVLKFHVNDRRQLVYDRWVARVNELLETNDKSYKSN